MSEARTLGLTIFKSITRQVVATAALVLLRLLHLSHIRCCCNSALSVLDVTQTYKSMTCCTACRDSDHKVTKGDVVAAIGPLMHTAQAGMVFMGSSGGPGGDPLRGTSVWEDFRDSMRELATDQVAAAIATGAFDTVDPQHTGRIQGDDSRHLQLCRNKHIGMCIKLLQRMPPLVAK